MIRVTVMSMLLAACGPGQKAPEERFELANGMTVILKDVRHMDVIVTGIAYRAGVVDEPEGKQGLAHIVEHLVVRSAIPSYPRYEAEKKFLDDGIINKPHQDSNAETLHDFTYYYSIQPDENFEAQLKIESERMRKANFDETLLDGERPKVLNEIKNVTNNPSGRAYNRLLEMTFSKAGYRNPKAGVEKSVREITLEDAGKFYRTFYRPDRATLVIYGKLPKNAKALVKKYFSPILNPEDKVPEPAKEPHKAKGGKANVDLPKNVLPQIMMTYKSAAPDTHEQAVMQSIVYELRKRLDREPRVGGLTTRRDVYDDFGTRGRSMVTFSYYMGGQGSPNQVIAGTQAVIDDIAANPPSAKTLKGYAATFKRDTSRSDTFQLQFIKNDKEKYLNALAQAVINRLRRNIPGPDRVKNLIAEMEKVTPEEVKAAVAKYFSKARGNVIILRPK